MDDFGLKYPEPGREKSLCQLTLRIRRNWVIFTIKQVGSVCKDSLSGVYTTRRSPESTIFMLRYRNYGDDNGAVSRMPLLFRYCTDM